MYNTRLNPTANGPLHIGHLYMALVNQAEAHASGGKFVVRMEDNQPEWVWRLGIKQIGYYCISARQDLEWCGVLADEWIVQSEIECKVADTMQFLPGELRGEHKFMFRPVEAPRSPIHHYPYAPYLTAEKVVMDMMSGVNLLIRGYDLISEHCLYLHFCDLFGLQFPRMVYLPRLCLPGGEDVQPDVSKTIGNYKIEDFYRRGCSAVELLDLLSISCLLDPSKPWLIDNVKAKPIWIG